MRKRLFCCPIYGRFVFVRKTYEGGLLKIAQVPPERGCPQNWGYCIFWEQHRSDGIWRFRCADDQFPILPRNAFIDGQRVVLNVQVFPPQGQQFSAAQACGQFQIHRREDSMLFRCTQIWADQCFGQNFHFLASVFRDFAFLCRVRKNQLLLHRIF